MSGGALNYLFAKDDPSQIIDTAEYVEEVEEFLAARGLYEDNYVRSYKTLIKWMRATLVKWQTRLAPIFKLVEWTMSGDMGEETFEEQIRELRESETGEKLHDYSEYEIPKVCEKCGSENIILRVHFTTRIVTYSCQEPGCGGGRCLSKNENKRKRGSALYARWRQRAIQQHPYCQLCGNEKDLVVHHTVPAAAAPELITDDRNAMVLCAKCHNMLHKAYKEVINGTKV